MPVATTVLTVPAEVNVNPFVRFATNVHPLNDPPETVQVPPVSVIDVLVSVSSKVIDVSVEANPLPEAVTVTPLGPYLGLNVSVVCVPVNVWLALSDATLPVAVTGFATPAPEPNENPFVGFAMNVQPLNAPEVTAQVPPPLVMGIDLLPMESVTDVSVDANPLPDAVTVTPLGPDEGESVRLVVVPVNVAVAVSPAAFPVAVTVFAVPLLLLNEKPVDVLAVKVQPENDPELTVQVEGVVDREVVVLPTVTVNVTLVSVDANPLPDAVTVTPEGPLVGETTSTGAGLMPKVAKAQFVDEVSDSASVYEPAVLLEEAMTEESVSALEIAVPPEGMAQVSTVHEFVSAVMGGAVAVVPRTPRMRSAGM